MEKREDGRVRSDPDRQREDRRQAEHRVPPGREVRSEVAEQRLQTHKDVALARGLLLPDGAAEAPLRLAPRVLGRGTGGFQVVGRSARWKATSRSMSSETWVRRGRR